MLSRCVTTLPLAGLLFASARVALAQTQTCFSYGIDFVSGGSYFINTDSNVNFTCVTQFSGCQNDTADVILTDPNGDEWYCSDIPLQPDYTSEMSTCPIEKSQMTSGDWDILLISNNGDGIPIAYEREFYITAGPQATVTATPTLLFNYTTTPTVTVTTTTTFTSGTTLNNTETVTIPSATHTDTITLSPKTVTATTTLTRTFKTWVKTAIVVTSTTTATCTVPPRPEYPDPTWSFQPVILKSTPTGLSHVPTGRAAKRSIEEMREIRDQMRKERRSGRLADEVERAEVQRRDIARRSADQPTVTVTETTSTVTSTQTITGTTSTVLDIVEATVYPTVTLPPATVYSGYAEKTVTAPRSTRTKLSVTTTYTWSVGTITASLVEWSTVTPSASVTACKKEGGHFGGSYGFF